MLLFLMNCFGYNIVFCYDFRSLLLRRECCTFSNGEYVKSGLAELEQWCCQAKDEVNFFSWFNHFVFLQFADATECLFVITCCSYNTLKIQSCKWLSQIHSLNSLGLQYAGSSWDELKHIRQAVGFLVCLLFWY